jgi:hypothetical protein
LPKTNDGNKYILVILDILDILWIFWYNSMIQEEFSCHFDDRIPIILHTAFTKQIWIKIIILLYLYDLYFLTNNINPKLWIQISYSVMAWEFFLNHWIVSKYP